MTDYNRIPFSTRATGLSTAQATNIIDKAIEKIVFPANNEIISSFVTGTNLTQLTNVTGLGEANSNPSTTLDRLGNTLAYSDTSPTNIGSVTVYKLVLKTWQKIGQTLTGNALGSGFGCSIQLNSAGDILVVGSKSYKTEGAVYVFQLIGNSWTQIGQIISGASQVGSNFGASVSINDTGDIVACGAPSESDGTGSSQGCVRVYELISGVWTQRGIDLVGENDLDEFGTVALNASGSHLIVGAPENSTYGSITSFSYNATDYIQLGSKVVGSAYVDPTNGSGDLFGSYVSMADDGLTVLAHSSQKAITYEYTTDWVQKGSQLVSATTTLTSNAELSGDGNRIAFFSTTGDPATSQITEGGYTTDWTPEFVKTIIDLPSLDFMSLAYSKDGNCLTAVSSGLNQTLYSFKRIIAQADLTFFEPDGVSILARIRAVQSSSSLFASEVVIQVKNASGVLEDGLRILPA